MEPLIRIVKPGTEEKLMGYQKDCTGRVLMKARSKDSNQ